MTLKKLTHDHYIIVDDSEIKEGDYYLRYNQSIMKCTSIKLQFNEALNKEETIICSDGCGDPYERSKHFLKKITHSTQPIEFAWAQEGRDIVSKKVYIKVDPLSLQEVKELIGEVDVEKKAERDRLDTGWEDSANLPYTSGFVRGYNQALEDNKDKKWTDEDVIRIVEKSRATGLTAEYIIQSLQTKTEWEVEIVDGKLKLK